MSLRGDREIIIRGGLGSCNSKEGLPGVRGDKRCKVYEEEVEVRRREVRVRVRVRVRPRLRLESKSLGRPERLYRTAGIERYVQVMLLLLLLCGVVSRSP